MGQNVNAYNFENFRLSNLILELEKLSGIERIRYTTSHPKHMTDDLRDVYKICKHIREKEFWKTQFLSLPKLRNVDKNGDKWINRFNAIYLDDNKPDAFKKIKDLIEFKIYTDVDGKQRLGAITKSAKLNEYNLTQLLNGSEILEVLKYLKNE